ncbi:MAG: hypothetical protein K0Q64_1821, partial [Nitrobacter vulgaris]|nr:hypothetical protein [Nitrobacter vulgaris]
PLRRGLLRSSRNRRPLYCQTKARRAFPKAPVLAKGCLAGFVSAQELPIPMCCPLFEGEVP